MNENNGDPRDVPDLIELHALQDATAWDAADRRLGKVGQVYVDGAGRPQWVSIPLGLFGTREHVVPLHGARLGEGEYAQDLHVSFAFDDIKHAPDVDHRTQLSPEDEARLLEHYGL
ncbi:MAG: PRC-barrel domain-containing protein [Arthrobacter sp.]|uniref:PRC-barrel domain-containing protein n=1 Tax=Arthrobacter sp. TaxID=1667 RepID=UPI0034811BBD